MSDVDDVSGEVESLRKRVAELEAERAARPRPPRWRTALATVFLILGGFLLPVGLVGIWADRTVNDTDRYVETVAPLIDDLQVQNRLADEITAALFANVDVEALIQEVLPPRADPLASPLTNGLESFVRSEVLDLLEQPAAQEAWARVNAELQSRIIAALRGESDGSVTIQGDAIVLDTGFLIEQVRDLLVERGFTIVEGVPIPDVVDREIVLLRSEQVVTISRVYQLTDVATSWLIWIALGLLVAAVIAGGDRRRWLLAAGVVMALGAGLVTAALAIGRESLLASLGAASESFEASLYDILTRFLEGLARAGIVLGVVIALGAWLAGPGSTPVGIRRGIVAGESALARTLVRYLPGLATFGAALARWRSAVLVVIVGLGALSVFGRADLSAGRVLWTAALVVIGWLILDTLVRTGDYVDAVTSEPPADPDDELAAASAPGPEADPAP
jgi:hypothetical protein